MTEIKKILKKAKNYQVEGYSDNYSNVVHRKKYIKTIINLN